MRAFRKCNFTKFRQITNNYLKSSDSYGQKPLGEGGFLKTLLALIGLSLVSIYVVRIASTCLRSVFKLSIFNKKYLPSMCCDHGDQALGALQLRPEQVNLCWIFETNLLGVRYFYFSVHMCCFPNVHGDIQVDSDNINIIFGGQGW